MLNGNEVDHVIPWDRIAKMTIQGEFDPTITITSVAGKEEVFKKVSGGVEIEWSDSVARSQLSLHTLSGATISFTERK
jgi:hypothetical protein